MYECTSFPDQMAAVPNKGDLAEGLYDPYLPLVAQNTLTWTLSVCQANVSYFTIFDYVFGMKVLKMTKFASIKLQTLWYT